MAQKKTKTALVLASEEKLKSLSITDIPSGAIVRVVRELKQEHPQYGNMIEIEYKIKGFNYFIPKKWLGI